MAIVDRSFCNLAAMARWKYQSRFADYLFKIGSCGWQAQNDFYMLRPHEFEADKADSGNQMRETQNTVEDLERGKRQKADSKEIKRACYKVITQDRHDEIVEV